MTIEFNCPNCQKLLRTKDDKAGAMAKCPDCGNPVTVPDSAADEDPWGDTGLEADVPAAPSDSEGFDDTKDCPMCGGEIKAAAIRCRHCGEELEGSGGELHPTTIEAGEVISASWDIYKSNFGISLGGFVLVLVINYAVNIPSNVIQALMPNMQGNEEIMLGLLFVFAILAWVVQMYLMAGQTILFLKIARGQNAQISDIFSGGKYVLPLIGNSILLFLIIIAGLILFIIPGIIFSLMFAPYSYVLVDKNPGGIGPLTVAKVITKGNLLSLFVLALAGFGIQLLGLLALCVGFLFTSPLVLLMFAVAYCRMSGQRTAEA
jgi:DNA-directed RNA polymerase subunit RPC12/RpoP